MLPPLPRIRPGQQPTADEWNAVVAYLEQFSGVSGSAFGGAVGVGRAAGGVQVFDGRERGHWAKLTSKGSGNAYAHQSAVSNGDGTFTDIAASGPGSVWGTTTVSPAREVNGLVVRTPVYVWLWPDSAMPTSQGFLFEVGGTADFFAEVTGGSDAAGYSGKRVVLTGANTWTDATAPTPLTFTNNIWRARSNRVSPELPPIAAGQLVRVWPSPTYGPVASVTQYECHPWGSQNEFSQDVVTAVECVGGSLRVTTKTLELYARDIVGFLTNRLVAENGNRLITEGGDSLNGE